MAEVIVTIEFRNNIVNLVYQDTSVTPMSPELFAQSMKDYQTRDPVVISGETKMIFIFCPNDDPGKCDYGVFTEQSLNQALALYQALQKLELPRLQLVTDRVRDWLETQVSLVVESYELLGDAGFPTCYIPWII